MPVVFKGVAAGILAGSLIGLAEASYVVGSGAPDSLAPLYAVILYGLIGLPMGLGCGIGLALGSRFVREIPGWLAWGVSFAAVATPLGLVIGRYVVNKVVYLEQGVPLIGLLGVLAALVAIDLVVLGAAYALRDTPLGALGAPKGFGIAWGGLVALTGLGALLGGVDAPSWAHGRTAPAALVDKPNVLFIMVDTLRADHLGAYGMPGDPTPAIDAFARDAVLFELAFAAASWTRSSGASLFTSRLPSSHNADTKAARLPEDAVTFAEVLRDGGVTTGALINNINMTATFNFDQGFDTFVYEAPAYKLGGTESVFGLSMYKLMLKVLERVPGSSKHVEHYYQPADVVFADAQRFINENRDSRWALFVQLMEPHDPYFEHPSVDGTGEADYNGVGFARSEVEHPDPSQAEYLKRVYLDEVRFMDRDFAALFAWMKAEGIYDDTLVVLTSDHGEEFFEHGGWWHGTTLYDEQLHVPLIVKLPGNAHAGTRAPWQVRTIDVAPTITASLGLAPDPSWQGQDLIADLAPAPVEEPADAGEGVGAEGVAAEGVAAEGADAEVPAPDAAPPRGHALDRVVIAEEDFEGNVIAALRKGGFKCIRANEGNPRGLRAEELYDVIADPGEQHEQLESGGAVDGIYGADRVRACLEDLDLVIRSSEAGSVHGGDATLSPEEREILKALGYLDAASE